MKWWRTEIRLNIADLDDITFGRVADATYAITDPSVTDADLAASGDVIWFSAYVRAATGAEAKGLLTTFAEKVMEKAVVQHR